ncbi:hypothetical protein GK047_21865 [Paenibacillus sp. SYP-B3998]|uniref:Tyrosine-type recombinase/integrase n=1 Tax=Paenibacillus sp. SYP-B3998 TaxID=2678564 RepID=A0A6G4A4S1_9BACL|nr:hypothetical protein [Paenibacillus sp. SYP-B3998]
MEQPDDGPQLAHFPARRGTPLGRASIIQMLRHYCRNAKLIGVRGSAHTFCHTMAKKFLLNDGSVYALQRILRHYMLEITRHYVNLLQINLHAQHEKWSPNPINKK